MMWRSLGESNPCFSLERAAGREAEETSNIGANSFWTVSQMTLKRLDERRRPRRRLLDRAFLFSNQKVFS